MKILFITSNRVGDAVLSLGLLNWLVEQYPEARFTIACGPYAADLFQATPRLDRVIILRKRTWNRHWIELWKHCVGTRWDRIVDLRNSLVSHLLVTAQRDGYARKSVLHKVLANAAILNLTPPPAPHIYLNDRAIQQAATLLPKERPLLALAPAANWPCKQWPIEKFIALTRTLTAPEGALAGASVLVLADERERAQIAPLLDSIPTERRVEIIGQDLLTVAACLKQARLFIGNDSGLMHIAAAMETPTLGLFGPGLEEIYGPWGTHCATIRTPESREELLSLLPFPGAHTPNLMESLTVKRVCEAATDLILYQRP